MCTSCRFLLLVVVATAYSASPRAHTAETGVSSGAVRIATFNASLYRDTSGELIRDLEGGANNQARRIAEIIQRVRPHVLLVNEFDYDVAGHAASIFRKQYLARAQNGCQGIDYPHYFTGPVNTGKPSGRDLDHDGRVDGPGDAIGFGRHQGQYGMLVLSQFPIKCGHVRTFQNFLWRDLRGALLPTDGQSATAYYDDDDLAVLALSSKSVFDVPVEVPIRPGRCSFTLHLIASHPTPPVFDGSEDRNGKRNHDEIRMLAEYVAPDRGTYLIDDKGRRGSLAGDALFVIAGDLNADPLDGDSVPGAMAQLLEHPRINSEFVPESEGGKLATQRKQSSLPPERGDPARDTTDFGKYRNLRIDYVLPSKGLRVVDGAVFWPAPGEPGSEAITASDHRLVWVDVKPE